MSVPPWVTELVRAFWADAGSVESFPRTLRRPIARALPVSICRACGWTVCVAGCARTASSAHAMRGTVLYRLVW